MILVDANVLMYAAGAPHRLKRPSADLLDRIARGEVDAVLDAARRILDDRPEASARDAVHAAPPLAASTVRRRSAPGTGTSIASRA